MLKYCAFSLKIFKILRIEKSEMAILVFHLECFDESFNVINNYVVYILV